MMLLSIAPKRKSEPEPVTFRRKVHLRCPNTMCRRVYDETTEDADDPRPVIRDTLLMCPACRATWQNGWTIPQ